MRPRLGYDGCFVALCPSQPLMTADSVRPYTLRNAAGMIVGLTNYGATITALHVPDRDGRFDDVLLGFDDVAGFLGEHPFFGCTVGRVANRIANARFTLDGETYKLAANIGPNHLHGGVRGFNAVVWDAEPFESADGAGVRFSYHSADGEEGYPGNLDAEARYTLTDDNELRIEMTATTDAPTIVNLANHAYYNLTGQTGGTVLDHVLTLHAHHYTPTDDALIITGEIAPVAGTVFDFTQPRPIGAQANGDYDVNFVVDAPGSVRPVAEVYEPKSGRVMTLRSDQPGVQLYTSRGLDGTLRGKGGVAYPRFGGFCLETQTHPNAINQPNFPSPVLRPGETYRHHMSLRFSTR